MAANDDTAGARHAALTGLAALPARRVPRVVGQDPHGHRHRPVHRRTRLRPRPLQDAMIGALAASTLVGIIEAAVLRDACRTTPASR